MYRPPPPRYYMNSMSHQNFQQPNNYNPSLRLFTRHYRTTVVNPRPSHTTMDNFHGYIRSVDDQNNFIANSRKTFVKNG